MAEVKRVQVSFTAQQWKLLYQFKGELGESDAEIIRTIVLSWLSEKSFITDTVKSKMKNENAK
jgi:hypothetical protein